MSSAFRAEVSEILSTPIEAHIICIPLILLLGCIGNGVVIYVYFRKSTSTYTENIFVKTLAILDLAACAILAPFILLLDLLRYELSPTLAYFFVYDFYRNISFVFDQ